MKSAVHEVSCGAHIIVLRDLARGKRATDQTRRSKSDKERESRAKCYRWLDFKLIRLKLGIQSGAKINGKRRE